MSTIEERAGDRRRLEGWTRGLVATPEALPISFRYGDEDVRGIPETWAPTMRRQTVAPGVTAQVFEGREPSSGLTVKVEVIQYAGHPVVEWTAWLTNSGSAPSEVVDGLLGLDARFAGPTPTVEHGNGDFYSGEGYRWERTAIRPEAPISMAPTGGRPCDQAFPYFRVLFEGSGLTVAVGWPGQWEATVAAEGDGFRIQAGQQATHLRLLPGETIRTPRMALLAWDGARTRGVNLWREWYRAHVMPRPGGRPLRPLLSVAGTDEGEEFTGATGANQVEYQRRWAAKGIDFDVWWIDAGWYPCDDGHGKLRWPLTGSWYADPHRFPDGLGPVGTSANALGAKFLLWFEPERVVPGTELAEHHAEWILPRTNLDGLDPNSIQAHSGLLNLGHPEAKAWLIDRVSGLIEEYGIGIYRQDFNFEPLLHWRENDADDRRGITENLHVQGYLEYWDALLERYPDLMIDSCASGGRRNDLETMRRSVPLHYTDYGYGIPATKLDFHHTLFEWLPFFRETNLCWEIEESRQAGLDAAEGDSFSLHCAIAPMLSYIQDIKSDAFDFSSLGPMTAAWRRMGDLLLDGDYYALTPAERSDEAWVAWQFHRRDGSDGVVQAIRLSQAPKDSLPLLLEGLRPEARYRLEDAETGRQAELTGAQLAAGDLVVTQPPRAGSIWFYEEIGA